MGNIGAVWNQNLSRSSTGQASPLSPEGARKGVLKEACEQPVNEKMRAARAMPLGVIARPEG